jgi:hypothetical protein
LEQPARRERGENKEHRDSLDLRDRKEKSARKEIQAIRVKLVRPGPREKLEYKDHPG